ncbi:MAG TPA: T9SS type A sorting domain-containing protein, partial [Paludibacter sp.]|nr:T9SS type A sorting domain-containing protein [Paludibacter sp.]
DLKTWTKASNISFGYECPDFFELPVDDGATKKWVLLEADSKYYIGTFNGTTFTPDAGGPYTMVNNSGIGAGFYASQTFFTSNFPGNRIIQMGWMSGLAAGNTAPWTHNATFPCEVKLKTFPEGVRATRTPIPEISNLYGDTQTWGSQTIGSNQNLFAGKMSKCYDIEAVIDVSGTTATSITFQLANRTFTYDLQNQTFLGASLKPINNLVKIRLLVDRGEFEAFGNDGQLSYAQNFKFLPSNGTISMIGNGSIKLVSARYSTVNRVWPGAACTAYADDPVSSGTTYTGNWIVASGESGYYNTTLHVSNTTGAYTEYSFNGTQISWYGLKNNDLGMATVYIDGALAADNIDCYSTERITQQLFTKTDLPAGNHIIKVAVKGTKNASSAGTALVHDYFGTVASLTSPTAADDADPKTAYTGTWVTDVNGIYYNTTCHVTNTTGSYFQYDFTGTQVYWYGLKNNDLGMAAVYIDGVLAADNIDCYSNTKAINLLFCKTNLSNTTHTVKVVVKGTKNAASAGTAIVHDYFDFPAIAPIYVDDADSRTIYTGTWGTDNNAIYYNNTCHYGNASNGAVEFNFNGTQVSWYALTNNDLGIASIYIDGVWVKDVDCYGTDRLVHLMFTTNTLSKGNHTIKVAVKGTKNVASSGVYLVHDYFMVPDVASIAVAGNLVFGNVTQNSTATKILTISNTSNEPLVVSNIVLPDGFTADWTSGEVAVQKDQKVTITFTPAEVKAYSGTIKVNSNAEGGLDEITVSGTGTLGTALTEIDGIEMKIYPNPVQNTLRVTTKDLCNIEISDIAGKVIFNKMMEGNTTTIDMSAFTSGVFFLKAVNAKGEFSIQKTIKT